MKLCVNYLEEVKELVEEEKIGFIDYIKLFSINGDLSPLDWCASKKDVMFHGLAGEKASNVADIDFFKDRDIKLQKRYFEISRTPYMSMHINALSDIPQNEEDALKVIKENVSRLTKEFDKKILLENIPGIWGRGDLNFYSSPEFISKVIAETNTGFLFDIGHARVASEVLNIPFDEYVNRLPMNKIEEIHLSGCMKNSKGRLVANHSKMNEEDFKFLSKLLEKSKTLKVVTLAYGIIKVGTVIGNPPVVAYGIVNERAKEEVYTQLLRLKEMLKK